jgi:NTE family protein
VDFEALRRQHGPELFISATNVHNGELRIFTRDQITPEAVMASACLPLLFRAVEIDGVSYWDGGYSGNPAITPFLRATSAEDVLLIQINPRERRKTPTRTPEIMTRLNEINFNASLLSELRGVAFVNRLVDEGRLPRGVGPSEFHRLRMHRILMEELGETSRAPSTLTTDYQTFEMLRKLGQRATRRFLNSHFADIGRRSTIDIPEPAELAPVE